MEVNRFYAIIAVLSLVFILITCLLGKYFKNKKAIKYIPAMVAAIGGMAFCIKALYFSESFQRIGYLILTFITIPAFAVSLVTALIMEFVYRKTGHEQK